MSGRAAFSQVRRLGRRRLMLLMLNVAIFISASWAHRKPGHLGRVLQVQARKLVCTRKGFAHGVSRVAILAHKLIEPIPTHPKRLGPVPDFPVFAQADAASILRRAFFQIVGHHFLLRFQNVISFLPA